MKKMILLFAVMVFGFSTMAHATLIYRGADTLGNKLIYDTDLNITWYDYTSAANSWQNQVNWASNLSVTFGSQTFDDWRLPTTIPECVGLNCTGSEMGHLWYTELGNTGGAITNSGDFVNWEFNIAGNAAYWSSTESSFWGSSVHYVFLPFTGVQDMSVDNQYYAMVVLPGDVAAAAVPEPGTLMLLGSGLVGLVGMKRRFRA